MHLVTFTQVQDEMAEAAHGYLAYAGKYELDEETKPFIIR